MKIFVTLAILACIALVPVMGMAVDRTDSQQDRAIDALCLEVFGTADCPVEEPTATPTTPAPTATPTTPAPTATPDHSAMAHWHAPGAHDGLPAHEHGDAVPAWVTAAGYDPAFTHAANTVGENNVDHAALKHTGFKAFSGSMNGFNIYLIMHLDTTPSGHTSRFHSYQFWMQDPAGGVSHLHGWFDYGDGANEGPNLRRVGCDSTTIRPIMAVRDEGCSDEFESWYSGPGRAWIDTGFNIKAQYFTGGNPLDPSTWNPTGRANDVRRVEVAFYKNAGKPTGTFWSTQFREVVSGPSDPLCGTTVTTGAKTYTRLCLEQYIAPTATTLAFPGNSLQKTYPMASPFTLPN